MGLMRESIQPHYYISQHLVSIAHPSHLNKCIAWASQGEVRRTNDVVCEFAHLLEQKAWQGQLRERRGITPNLLTSLRLGTLPKEWKRFCWYGRLCLQRRSPLGAVSSQSRLASSVSPSLQVPVARGFSLHQRVLKPSGPDLVPLEGKISCHRDSCIPPTLHGAMHLAGLLLN